MAKELPYFKFEPGEWQNGNIRYCSNEAKGVFIDLCSYYWMKLGEVKFDFAKQVVCKSNANEFQELCSMEILKVDGEFLSIEFLDKQLNEFENVSEKRRKAAEKRWNNANDMQMHSKSNAIREEKKREEERKEEKPEKNSGDDVEEIIFPFNSKAFKDKWDLWKDFKLKEYKFKYKSKISEQAALKKLNEISNYKEETAIEIIMQSIENGWKGFFELKQKQNGSTKDNMAGMRNYLQGLTEGKY